MLKSIHSFYGLLSGKAKIVSTECFEKSEELRKENEEMKKEIYSARAARSIIDEMREILNCPVGQDIVEAIKRLKNNNE